jgi:site-specific recombinase XerD
MTEAAPTRENRTLRRLPNAAYRQREYLTEAEVERLIEAARKRGRNGPRDAAAWFLRMVQRTGQAAKLPFPVHPHMLRHSTGYKLANDGHDTRSLAHYLGHRNLQSTARYTALAEGRFKGFWRD